jgi:hypothetical protein
MSFGRGTRYPVANNMGACKSLAPDEKFCAAARSIQVHEVVYAALRQEPPSRAVRRSGRKLGIDRRGGRAQSSDVLGESEHGSAGNLNMRGFRERSVAE